MSLRRFEANKKLVERIQETVKTGRVFHAYIIEGDKLADKEGFAREFCKAILCQEAPGVGCDSCISCRKLDHDNYEDWHLIQAQGASVKNDQITALQEELKKKPMGPRHFAVIKDADLMTPRAQNRLLKTLEEPFEGTVMVLLSENRDNLLPTIRSRCVLFRLEAMGQEAGGLEAAEAVFQAVSEGKSFFAVKEILSKHMKNRQDALTLLDGLERIYEGLLTYQDQRHSLYKREDIIRAIELIEEARRDIYANVNHQYAVKNLIIKIGG